MASAVTDGGGAKPTDRLQGIGVKNRANNVETPSLPMMNLPMAMLAAARGEEIQLEQLCNNGLKNAGNRLVRLQFGRSNR